MFYSIIISTYNREDYIGSCLEHLAQQDYDNDLYEVLIIDNNSTDKTAEFSKAVIKKYPEVNFKYIFEKEQGLSFARNRGIKESSGQVIIFLDDDAFAFPGYLQEIEKFVKSGTEFSAFGGKIIPRFESERPEWMSDFLLPLASVIDLGNKIRKFPSKKFPIGANMGFKKEVFEKYGDFNVKLGRKGKGLEGSEEKDLFHRIRSGGENIYYIPDAVVEHLVPDRRLQISFIQKQANGIGISERIRVRDLGRRPYVDKAISEIVKWMVSVVLFFYYCLRMQCRKAVMIIKFRFWVSKGFFNF